MLGMVYTEFLEMVEARFSFDTVDAIIEEAGVDGVYTAVGHYDDRELIALIEALSSVEGVPVDDLLHAYGRYLFDVFLSQFPQFFEGRADALAFLSVLESHVHTEVRKLYPNTSPPLFDMHTDLGAHGTHQLSYRSDRGLWHFALGLLESTLAHYGGQHAVAEIEDHSGGAGTHVTFTIVEAPS